MSKEEIESKGNNFFHELQEITPQEALKILNETGKLARVKVGALHLKGDFANKIEIVDCHIFNLRVIKANFQKDFIIGGCTLTKAKIADSTMQNHTIFGGSTIQGLQINNCTFEKSVILDSAILELKGINIEDSTFKNKITCWNMETFAWFVILNCTFENIADFRSIHAHEGIKLEKSTFLGPVLLRGTTTEKRLSFIGSCFENIIDLSRAKMRDFAYFDEIQQGENQRFAFSNTLADRIQLTPEQIEGRLESEDKKDYATAMYEYGLLKSCYQILHQYESEDWAFYRFKLNQRRATPLSLLRPWSYFIRVLDIVLLDLSCRYGTDPLRAVLVALLLIIFFSFVYTFAHTGFLEPALLIGEDPSTWLNRFAYGAVISISTFTAGLANNLTEIAKGFTLALMLIEALLGTALWGLFVVAFGRKVIR